MRTRPFLALAFAALAASLAGQTPSFRTEANYVRVDVYPTASGRIVPDLSQGDFEVLENGVPQKVEQFERIEIATSAQPTVRRDPATVDEMRQAATDSRSFATTSSTWAPRRTPSSVSAPRRRAMRSVSSAAEMAPARSTRAWGIGQILGS